MRSHFTVEITEVFDDSSERVSVSGNDKLLAFLELWDNNVIPVWQSALDRQLEWLASWEFFGWDVFVLRVLAREHEIRTWSESYLLDGFKIVVCLKNSRRWSGEGSSPDLDLLGTELLDGLFFVLAGKIAVVSFIQSPRVIDWNVLLAERLEDGTAGLVRSLEKRSVSDVEFIVGILFRV